ncbi:MAG TPA: LysR family transcriptional regulator [Thermoleophilia bacterium]|nr:LysR family transcriptional regulator [Thermoleophilia bacterium]
MELIQLRYYVSIADALSFTKAAEMLRVSQPALSYQIRRLETELGTRLFDRGGRKIMLTPDGELFLPLAQAVLFRAEEAVRILREHLGVESGEVRVGCSPSVATYLMPRLLATFRRSHPRVKVSLSEGGDVELQRSVLEGAVDFAIVTTMGSPGTLDVTPLASEELLLALPLGHRFASRGRIALSELAHEDFVFPADSFKVTAQFIAACRSVGFEPRVAYQTGSFESAKGFVRQSLCLAVLPRMALHAEDNEGIVILEIEEDLSRQLSLIRGKNRSLTGAARALIAHVQASISQALEESAEFSPPAPAGMSHVTSVEA